ncbi:hypothetical protein UlMin_024302 [Ulmus minor]
MDTAHWPQGIGVVKPMEGSRSPMLADQRRTRPQKDQVLNCPRCNSTNTKFCYYNNYSLSQPRYFCKTCRRYWTEGGSLRNVPVGGGSRKNKRSSSYSSSLSSPSSSSSSKKIAHDHHHQHHISAPPTFPQSASQNPKIHHGQDLNLAYPPTDQDYQNQNPSTTASTSTHLSAMELLKTGIASRGLSSFMAPMSLPEQNTNIFSSSGFSNLQEFKPTLNFALDGYDHQSGFGGLHGVQETSARLLFPSTEDLKQVSSSTTTTEFEQNRGQAAGYWNGMLGGGSW